MFTMPGFLEMETLGPLRVLQPGQETRHEEIWHFWPLPELPMDDDALAEVFARCLPELRYPGDPS